MVPMYTPAPGFIWLPVAVLALLAATAWLWAATRVPVRLGAVIRLSCVFLAACAAVNGAEASLSAFGAAPLPPGAAVVRMTYLSAGLFLAVWATATHWHRGALSL